MEDYSFDLERSSDLDYGSSVGQFSEFPGGHDEFSVPSMSAGSRATERDPISASLTRIQVGGYRRELLRRSLVGAGVKAKRLTEASVTVHATNSLARKQFAQALKAWYLKNQKLRLKSEESKFHFIKLEYSQETLALSGGFSPSRKLAEFWLRGVNSFRPENTGGSPVSSVNVNFEIQSDFAKHLTSTFATYAQQKRYSAKRDSEITINQRFQIFLQTELCEKFQIIPDESPEFLSTLYSELVIALSDGIQIAGNWGSVLVTENNDLSFALSAPAFARDPEFVRSEDVE